MGPGSQNEPMSLPAPVWFVAALTPMVASQVIRLHQNDPGAWIFWDYGCNGLACRIPPGTNANAVVASPLVGHRRHARRSLRRGLDQENRQQSVPLDSSWTYPQPGDWLYWLDTVLGIALVAYSEEVVFRRCARQVFQPHLGDGWLLVLVTSLLFGAYHWWTGIGNILEAALMGVLFVVFLQRSAALWPVVLSHYLTDIADFA
jgi:membrane protease YdiL (CAAX protease family)